MPLDAHGVQSDQSGQQFTMVSTKETHIYACIKLERQTGASEKIIKEVVTFQIGHSNYVKRYKSVHKNYCFIGLS